MVRDEIFRIFTSVAFKFLYDIKHGENIAQTMPESCEIPELASGPSMFAVDPAAENGDVPHYAPSRPLVLMSNGQVFLRLGTKSEGPEALL